MLVAVSQAPSPESNPNSPSPVTTIVGHYPTIERSTRYAAQETHPDAQGKQSLVALLKRYARVEVAAQADIQPPVTNQTPLMHLYGRHPRRTIQLRATPLAPRPSKQPKAKTTPRMHRTIREQVH
ncbi:hypothetical protein L2E82_52917 [Cichorium intybus]|nr:hypothetical protein L2E82_52917 [Cichorium intybus]